MKKVIWTLAMLALTCGAAAAQDVNEPAQQMPDRPMYQSSSLDKALIANERKIYDALGKGDRTAFTALVASTGSMADGSGVMKMSDLIASLDQIKITSWAISDEKVSWIDGNTAIVTYKFTGEGTFQGQPMSSPVYASTVWTKKGDKWVAVFHQESDARK